MVNASLCLFLLFYLEKVIPEMFSVCLCLAVFLNRYIIYQNKFYSALELNDIFWNDEVACSFSLKAGVQL